MKLEAKCPECEEWEDASGLRGLLSWSYNHGFKHTRTYSHLRSLRLAPKSGIVIK
jgi:hypothetical protein